MHREEPVSATHQMYLKALFALSRLHPVGRVRDLAQTLGLTPGTVSTGLNRLQELGLVERERYGGAVLTPAGAAVARCVARRFETLKALLIEVFGLEVEAAELDACGMEHTVSPKAVNRMEALLSRLRSGASIDLSGLARLNRNVRSSCRACEAADICQAAESVAASGA